MACALGTWGSGAGGGFGTPTRVSPSAPAGEILVRFRDSIKNWDAMKTGGNLEGWDDATPTYLWHGVVLNFDLRVREM